MSNSDRFSKTITAADANNIVLLLDFNQILAPYEQFKADNIVEHTIALEDLHAKVGLFSLLEAGWIDTLTALTSEAQQEAARAKILKEGQKVYLELYTAKGNGPWERQGEEILQNKNGLEQPWSLMLLLGTNVTALFGESSKIGIKIASKAQGVGGLKGGDYVHISGTWRKNTKIESKKKDDGVEALKLEIETLKLAISGRFTDVPANTLLGRGELAGVVENIPQSTFTTPIQAQTLINLAISALVEGAPGTLNTIDELAAAINDNANFGVAVTDLINARALISNSLQLTTRSNTIAAPFDANSWIPLSFAAIKWVDGGQTNLYVPVNTGIIFLIDPLFGTGVAGKYCLQFYFSGVRYFMRIQNNSVWGGWREIATSPT